MRALWLGATMAALGAALCGGSAQADGYIVQRSDPYVYVAPDLPVVYDWTGLYIGGHLGAANARNELTVDDPASLFGPEIFGNSQTSFAGGAHIGLQKQWSWIVLGAEVAWTWMDEMEHVRPIITSTPDLTLTKSSHSVLAVTGKFGWAWDNILAYFKGGWATTEIDYALGTQALVRSSSRRASGSMAGLPGPASNTRSGST